MSRSGAETLFGDEHVRRYRESGGEVGHVWKRGSKILLLTTTGRKTGRKHTTPLIYDDYARKTSREIPVVVLERA